MKVYVVSAHYLGDDDPREVLGAGRSRYWAGDLLKKHLEARHEADLTAQKIGGYEDDTLDELREMKENIDAWVADPDETDYGTRCSDARYWIEQKEIA